MSDHRNEHWELWSHDHFDDAAAPSLDAEGYGLEAGLAALWARALRERVTAEGYRGFISFDLRWDGRRIRVPENFALLAKVRAWLPAPEQATADEVADGALIRAVAAAHAHALRHRGAAAEAILESARDCDDAQQFLEVLDTRRGGA